MKRLLIITQKVDESDDLLGFFVSWISEFAKHFERVDVIALAAGGYDLPSNVHIHSLGKEHGTAKVVQALRLCRFLWRYTPGRGAVFAHMSPIFAIIAWPLATFRRSRLVLWYLHRSVTLRLRIAVALSAVIVTADAASLKIKNPKIVSVGHGIDTARFAMTRAWAQVAHRPLRILGVGRLSPIKDFATLIRSVGLLRDHEFPVQLHIVGRSVMYGDRGYERELRELVARLGLQDLVYFVGFIPHSAIVTQYAWADVVVGCTPPGGIDKALLEAMAAGCIVLTSNTVMRSTLEPYADRLMFRHQDQQDLTDRIQALGEYGVISDSMVQNVREQHDLSATITKLAKLL